ncbi:hypothetical protein [Leifsonia sp. 1010]|uniref:hypothetical protein n=1 Tax=Leifsonia sp. 1010 TaxID=2817769 RepID=UPI002861364B|nr:hypothetical protein [Leifsonia sp. 1010]MDR6613593.1 hypothetical protein [Leifsonia sp. 1010]
MIDPIPDEPFTLTGPDGTTYDADPETAREHLARLVGGVMDITPRSPKDQFAQQQLWKVWSETKSAAYVQWLAEQSMQLIALEMLHSAQTWELAARLRHINALILGWRLIRPVEADDLVADAGSDLSS